MIKTIIVPSLIIILIVAFYRLAKKYNKSPWYSLLGILVFFVSFFIAENISSKFFSYLLNHDILDNSIYLEWFILIVVSVLVFGIILCRIIYKIIERKWEKEKAFISDPDILDDEMLN